MVRRSDWSGSGGATVLRNREGCGMTEGRLQSALAVAALVVVLAVLAAV
jgi:hypothetical protein